MTNAEKQALAQRLLNVWNQLTPAEKKQVQPLLSPAAPPIKTPKALKAAIKTNAGHMPEGIDYANDILRNNGYVPAPATAQLKALGPVIGSEGEIYGFKKYQQLDYGWLEAVVVWLEERNNQYKPFPATAPPVITIPDDVDIAVIGDWGTGNYKPGGSNSPSAKIASALTKLKPGIVIHLGDVYYAGTDGQEDDNLINQWPKLPAGTLNFTLNSNHEMYSGAVPLFTQALANPVFAAQGGYSFFALENSNWVIVCLDTAYYSSWGGMYMDGVLDTTQLNFLKAQAAKGKQLIVMCHHNAFNDSTNGPATNALWKQVKTALGSNMPAYWYWGHVHTGVAYKPLATQPGTSCRCVGHSAIPWASASVLKAQYNAGALQWYENKKANDPQTPARVVNGFGLLQVSGNSITENFYDENGVLSWQLKPGAAAKALVKPQAAKLKTPVKSKKAKPLAKPAKKAVAKKKK
ncbi:MAG: hypothetical protein RLZZ367_2473 [Bacteroidota bacterium]|jgi:hypothetical protein